MTEAIEVHNAYALYEINPDGSKAENPLLSFSRPQDWGDPQRWHYRYCRLECSFGERSYVNHCHLWQEQKRSDLEAYQIVSSYLFMVMQPGQPRELCDRSHLQEDDFWCHDWGKRPPYYEDEDENDDDGEGYYLEEPELIPPGSSLYCWRVWHPDQEKAILQAQAEPFDDPPFPTGALLFTLKSNGKGGHNMKDSGESDKPTTGFLFGTHLPEDQQLEPAWIERGWQIERQPSMERIR